MPFTLSSLLSPRWLIQKAALKLFPLWELCGLHVVPDHFHFPIPSTRDLDDALFEGESACVGLDWNPDRQMRCLTDVFPRFKDERQFERNAGLSPVDAAVLYAMVRCYKPRRIIEIGSGFSTGFIEAARLRNEQDGAPSEHIVINPYPHLTLGQLNPSLTTLRKQKVQATHLKDFEDCDLLFVDSSHIAGIGSDVNFLVLEVLPRVKPGCLIHFHDIVLPREYWKDWVKRDRLFWSEQYLLWAFLLFNTAFDVVWAAQNMQSKHSRALQQAFPAFNPERHRLSSFWIERRRDSPAAPRTHA